MDHLSVTLKKILAASVFALIVAGLSALSSNLDAGVNSLVAFVVVFFVLYVFEDWDED